jgi:hypothetical protein
MTNQKTSTWGYDAKTGEGQIFELGKGEKLPAGFVDSPAKVKPEGGGEAKPDAKASAKP